MTPEDNKQDVPTPAAPSVTPPVPAVPAPEAPAAVVPASTIPTANDDKVWVSKEEYQRLQQTAAPVAVGGTPKVPKLFSGLQIATTAIAAMALLIGLVSFDRGLNWLIVPAVIVLLLNGIFTWTDYLASKKPGYIVRTHKARNIVLLIAACLVLASPVLVIGVIIGFFVLMCAAGGCKGT